MTMLVEYWRWRYKDPVAGQICKTTARMTADEAASYPYARRIPGTLAYLDARTVEVWPDEIAEVASEAMRVAQPQ